MRDSESKTEEGIPNPVVYKINMYLRNRHSRECRTVFSQLNNYKLSLYKESNYFRVKFRRGVLNLLLHLNLTPDLNSQITIAIIFAATLKLQLRLSFTSEEFL